MRVQLIVLFVLSVLSSQVSALTRDELRVDLRVSDWCKNLTVEYFWQAFHPGAESRKKVARGTLNEDTPGEGVECEIPKTVLGGSLFLHAGHLINSQRGEAIFVSLGYEREIFQYAGFSIDGRVEAMNLEYEVPRKQTWLRGVILMPSVQGSYTFDNRKLGAVGVRQYFLPTADKITLTSFFWTVKF